MANEKQLIYREDLLAEYDRVHIGEPGNARKLIADAPTVDAVEVVHGRWVRLTQLYKCSKCSTVVASKWNYCPNCGACLLERHTGFEFDPHKYLNLFRDYKSEKFVFYGGMRGGGKILHLEQRLSYMHQELKKAKEEIERLNKELEEVRKDRNRWKNAAEWAAMKLQMINR